jgi:tripartite-type tricarboxylate transporter receptor subunit TctC
MDLAKSKEQTQMLKLVFARQPMGRPFLAASGIPGARVAALRKAFMDTLKDKQFLAEAKRAKLEINAVSGEEVQEIVHEVYQTPKEIAAKVADMLNR